MRNSTRADSVISPGHDGIGARPKMPMNDVIDLSQDPDDNDDVNDGNESLSNVSICIVYVQF